jgi:hypothetical protein
MIDSGLEIEYTNIRVDGRKREVRDYLKQSLTVC